MVEAPPTRSLWQPAPAQCGEKGVAEGGWRWMEWGCGLGGTGGQSGPGQGGGGGRDQGSFAAGPLPVPPA